MHIEQLCQIRRIGTVNWGTPLLVPSFSSRGFSNLGDMHRQLGEHTTDASLVSAFDLYEGHLSEDNIYCSEILFVDSGGFETGSSGDLSDMYNYIGQPSEEWTKERHLEVLRHLQPLCPLVVVNYDVHGSITEQVQNAKGFFADLPPTYASDFLIKPSSKKAQYVDLRALTTHCEEMAGFGIIGITEKELGSSFLQRCKNLVSIRKAFSEHRINVPIHIFGALDPLSVLAYFLCGADVFDGLSWLRLAYQQGAALYYNSYALIQGKWSRDNHSVFVRASLENLEQLSRIQALMGRFARTHEWGVLELEETYLKQLQALVGAAGVEM